jgi:hypothetical protein
MNPRCVSASSAPCSANTVVLPLSEPTAGLNQTSASSGLAEMARCFQFPSSSDMPTIGPTPR